MKLKTNPNSRNRNLIMTDPTKTVHIIIIIITISKPWQNYCIIFIFFTLCLYVQHKKRVKKKKKKQFLNRKMNDKKNKNRPAQR